MFSMMRSSDDLSERKPLLLLRMGSALIVINSPNVEFGVLFVANDEEGAHVLGIASLLMATVKLVTCGLDLTACGYAGKDLFADNNDPELRRCFSVFGSVLDLLTAIMGAILLLNAVLCSDGASVDGTVEPDTMLCSAMF